MTRPQDIQGRIENIHEIANIVATLRALATAHMVEVRVHLKAIRLYEANIATALSTALSLATVPPVMAAAGPGLAVVVGAAQGFCGGFADRLAQAAMAELAKGAKLMVVGSRTIGALAERDIAPMWTAEMAPHAREVPLLANRLADAIFAHLEDSPTSPVTVVFCDPAPAGSPIVRRSILPFDFGRFPPGKDRDVLLTLPVPKLAAALMAEYVFAEVCEALMLGFAAENAARAETMARAKSNVSRIATELKGEFQRARQEQMTTEIIELATGATALRP